MIKGVKIGHITSQITRDKIRNTLREKYKLGLVPTAFKLGHKTSEDVLKKMSNSWDYNKHINQEINEKRKQTMSKQEVKTKLVNSIKEQFENGREPWNKNKKGVMPKSWNELNLDSEKIIKMYTINKLSMKDIGKEFNCCISPIQRILEKNNIKIVNKGRFQKGIIPWSASQKGVDLCKKHKRGEEHYCFNNWSSLLPYDKNFNKQFKKLIRERDGGCLLCNLNFEDLHLLNRKTAIHHVNYNKLITCKENCCTLCTSCHTKTLINRNSWIKFFQSLLSERYGYKYSETGEIVLEI